MASQSGATSASHSTLQRISTSDLRPGMFLVRVLDSWWKSPFFVHRRMLNTVVEVEQLMSSGIREVEIDTALGVKVSSDAASEDGLVPSVDDISRTSGHQEDADENSHTAFSPDRGFPPDPTPNSEESKNREAVVLLREAVVAAVEGAFEGVKTGHLISEPAIREAAQALVQKSLAAPALVAEILLIDSLKQCDTSLYAHVVDTAVYAILIGLQLGWEEEKLERVGIAGLLHDVGYMRLPQNVVKAHWEGRSDSVLLQKHVVMGETLIKRQGQFSDDIVRMVKEHHAYQDGTGYPEGQGGALLSDSGQLLGLVDYFDELTTVGGAAAALPSAIAIRRLYQEAKNGKFATVYIEAMIRILGVFPVGTVVQLSTGEQAVVTKQHPNIGLVPQVTIFRGADGKQLREPLTCDLAEDASLGHDMSIAKVLDSTEYSVNLEEFFLS